MTDDELTAIVGDLRSGGSDGQHVEAKRGQTAVPRSVRNSLSAFSNTSGGVIILGLDEGGGFATTGVDNPAVTVAAIGEACSTGMEPPVRAVIETHAVESRHVVTVEVPEVLASQKPVYIKAAPRCRAVSTGRLTTTVRPSARWTARTAAGT